MLYTRLGRSSLEVCYIYPCCSVCAIYPCCTPRHLPSCAMPSRWDCQPALKLSSKCGCSCSPQLIPPIGAILAEWTVLSHLIETDLPFATLMLTHSDAYPRSAFVTTRRLCPQSQEVSMRRRSRLLCRPRLQC